MAEANKPQDLKLEENEEIRAFKDWWHQHGKQAVVLTLLVIAAYFGWETYTTVQMNSKSTQSATYEGLAMAYEQDRFAPVLTDARKFLLDYPSSDYAVGVATLLAKHAQDQAKSDEAKSQWQWIVDHANNDLMLIQAKLSLALLALDAGEAQAANEQLASLLAQTSSTQKPLVQYWLGVSQVTLAQTREAYDTFKALHQDPNLPASLKPLVEVQMNDLTP